MKFVKALFVTTLFFNLNVAIAASTAFPPESMLTPGAKLVVGEGAGNDFNVVDERDEARTRAATTIPHANVKKPIGPDVTPEMPAAQAPTLLPTKPVFPTGDTKLPTGLSAKSSKKVKHVATLNKKKVIEPKVIVKAKPKANPKIIAKAKPKAANTKIVAKTKPKAKTKIVAKVKPKTNPKVKPTKLANEKKITKFRFAENHNRTIHTIHSDKHLKS